MDDAVNDQIVIDVVGLAKRYGTIQAVEDITFSVAQGECVALLGPNGAGKTTTTEILAGFRHADEGTVRVLGVDPKHASRSWRTRIGVVLQNSLDLSDLTVNEAVHHVATFFDDCRDPDDVIALTGLHAKANDRIGRLSGGQRRRVDVALGIVGRPELLFLDEPTTGFDPAARRDFWDLIDTLKCEGTTILLTTHYLEEAERLADRVAVIAAGRIIATGTPQDLGNRADALATVTWQGDAGEQRQQTTTPTELIVALAEQFDGEIPKLQVLRPSLEDIYLSLINDQEQS